MPPTKKYKSYTAEFKLEVIEFAEKNGNRAAGRQYGIGEKSVRDWRKQEKYKSYTAEFKLEVIEFAEKNGNRAAGRQYGIGEKSVRNWRKQRNTILAMKKTKRANRGHKPRWPALEEKLEDFVHQQRVQQTGVPAVQLQRKAQAVAQEQQLPDFQDVYRIFGEDLANNQSTKMPPTKKYKSYTAEFKLKVVEFAEKNSNRAAGRLYGIGEKSVRDWRKQRDTMLAMKKTKRANRGHKPRWPELEQKLEDWFHQQRVQQKRVSTVQLRLKAQAVALEQQLPDFQGGPSWCLRFMRRKGLSMQTRTTVAQQLPADFAEKKDSFHNFVAEEVKQHAIDRDQIINMDEVPLSSDRLMTRSVDDKGSQTVSIPLETGQHTFKVALQELELAEIMSNAYGEAGVSSVQSSNFFHSSNDCKKKVTCQLRSPRRFTCPHCRQKFSRKFELVCHVRIHTGEKPFICKVCGKAYESSSQRAHRGKYLPSLYCKCCSFACKHCGKMFSLEHSLEKHEQTHTQDNSTCRRALCEICGKLFLKSSHVLAHICGGISRPFECRYCGDTFPASFRHGDTFPASFRHKQHEEVHTEEERFSCKYCGQKFSLGIK